MGDKPTPDPEEPAYSKDFDQMQLPEWTAVLFDICDVFRSNKEHGVDQMFETGVIDQMRLYDLVSTRLDKMHYWADASREFYDRFGRDYSLDEYEVTWPEEQSGYESSQWYLSALTEMLVVRHRVGKTTEHEWREREGDNEAFIVVKDQ